MFTSGGPTKEGWHSEPLCSLESSWVIKMAQAASLGLDTLSFKGKATRTGCLSISQKWDILSQKASVLLELSLSLLVLIQSITASKQQFSTCIVWPYSIDQEKQSWVSSALWWHPNSRALPSASYTYWTAWGKSDSSGYLTAYLPGDGTEMPQCYSLELVQKVGIESVEDSPSCSADQSKRIPWYEKQLRDPERSTGLHSSGCTLEVISHSDHGCFSLKPRPEIRLK